MSNIRSFTRSAPKEQLTTNYWLHEFLCKCQKNPARKPHVNFIDINHVHKVQKLHDMLSQAHGAPVKGIVTSAYRCPFWNKKVGGTSNSMHQKGIATDLQFYWKSGGRWVKIHPRTVAYYAEFVWGDDFGLGIYDTFTHIDSRGSKARW